MSDSTTEAVAADTPRGGRLLAAISNEMVGIYRRHYGRGPTRARTVMVEDVVLCRMLDPFTTSERTLIERGRLDEVKRIRHAFQQEMRVEFTEVVERLVGRQVDAFVSDVHVQPDMLIEMFFLRDGDISQEDPSGSFDPDSPPQAPAA